MEAEYRDLSTLRKPDWTGHVIAAIALSATATFGYYMYKENAKQEADKAALAKAEEEARAELIRKIEIENKIIQRESLMALEQARAQRKNEALQAYMTWRRDQPQVQASTVVDRQDPEYVAFAQGNYAYRCENQAGEVGLTDTPCSLGEKQSVLITDPNANVLQSAGIRSWARRNPEARISVNNLQINAEQRQAIKDAERYDKDIRCGNAQRALQFEQGWRSKNARTASRMMETLKECI